MSVTERDRIALFPRDLLGASAEYNTWIDDNVSLWSRNDVLKALGRKPMTKEQLEAYKASTIRPTLARFCYKHEKFWSALSATFAVLLVTIILATFSGIIFWGWVLSDEWFVVSGLSLAAALVAGLLFWRLYRFETSIPDPEQKRLLRSDPYSELRFNDIGVPGEYRDTLRRLDGLKEATCGAHIVDYRFEIWRDLMIVVFSTPAYGGEAPLFVWSMRRRKAPAA